MNIKPPSQRSLKVGEEIRHNIAQLLMRGEVHASDLRDASITISEVRVSPDLKNATVYFMPLGGKNKEIILDALKEHSGIIRHLLGSKLSLRYVPRLQFTLDVSFEEADKINQLLRLAPLPNE